MHNFDLKTRTNDSQDWFCGEEYNGELQKRANRLNTEKLISAKEFDKEFRL